MIYNLKKIKNLTFLYLKVKYIKKKNSLLEILCITAYAGT